MKEEAPAVHCRILKSAGRWLVPRAERPKLAPPPRELTAAEIRMDRSINGLNGLHKV